MTPVRLDFGYQDYERHGTDDEVRELVAEAVGDADAVLVPGSPLSHPDHEWVVRTVADAVLAAGRLGLYVEQPYGVPARAEPTPPWLRVALGGPLGFEDASAGLRDRLAKWRAVRAYESQLPLLALDGPKALAVVRASERIAWLDGSRL